MSARFPVGWRDEIGGLEFRVVQGHKRCRPCAEAGVQCDHDRRLEVWLESGGWRPVPMALAAMLCDFHACIEEVLYPRRPGSADQGALTFLAFLARAHRDGYAAAVAQLERERAAAYARRREVHA